MAGSIIINPISGTVGTPISVSGTGFTGTDLITVKYDGVTQKTVAAVGGIFSTSFPAPASSSGSHTVSATDQHSITASAPFDMTSNRSLGLAFAFRTLALEAPLSIIAGSSFRLSSSMTDFDGVTPLDATSHQIVLIDSKLNIQLTNTTPMHDSTGNYHLDLQLETWAANGDWLIQWIATFPDGLVTINDLVLTVKPQ